MAVVIAGVGSTWALRRAKYGTPVQCWIAGGGHRVGRLGGVGG